MIKKTAKLQVTDVYETKNWRHKVGQYNNNGVEFEMLKLSAVLDETAHIYKISKNLDDYVFVVARAVTANVPNENKDCFGEYELLSLKDDGRFVYETFNRVPLLTEHRDDDITTAGGVVVDSYYDDADEDDKKTVVLLAIDSKKKASMVSDLLRGKVQAFSMGCICEKTRCSYCSNVATVPSEFCTHIRNKFRHDKIGGKRVFEWCEGVTFREISHVKEPADVRALSLQYCKDDACYSLY